MSEESMESAAPSPEPTGHAAVDAVIASLEGLEDLPVAEQVPALESAHESLRAALSDAGDNPDA